MTHTSVHRRSSSRRIYRLFIGAMVLGWLLSPTPPLASANTQNRRQKRVAKKPARSKHVLKNPYHAGASPLSKGALVVADTRWHGETAPREFLRPDQYSQIRDGSMELLQRFDPAKHVFIGLGRSPTTIVAFLQNLGLSKEQAMNIPASGMRERTPDAAAWEKHLEHFLPKSVLEGDKDIVVMDRTSTGSSLLQAHQLIGAFLQRRGSPLKVQLLAFSSEARHPELIKHPQIGPSRINIDRATRPELYEMNRYSHWAEHGHYIVGESDTSGMKVRPEFKQYRDLLMERMRRDSTLSQMVKNINASGE